MPARKFSLIQIFAFILFVALFLACADKKATAPIDDSAPAGITDLIAGNATDSTITLQWTSPGDDADSGMAYGYDLRYSIYPITESNWNTASKVLGLPLPSLAGYLEEVTIDGLAPATRYFFAIKANDEIPHWSVLSNIATDRTTGTSATHWEELGNGLDGPAESMTLFQNSLVVGGIFMEAGEIRANHIAAWDDSSWSGLGQGMGGMEGSVTALAVYNGQIILPGRTGGHGGGISLFAWNGENWITIGSGFNDIVRALAVYDGRLIAAGDFNSKGPQSLNHIAAWDGSNWEPLGDGINGGVENLFVYGNLLIVGGTFDMAGGTTANRIASWDGSNWSALGSGISGGMRPEVSVMTEYNGKLIAGGLFDSAGDMAVSNIASWDGNSWTALGDGTNTAISGLAVYDNLLIAGGDFTSAGGYPVSRIASWDGANWGPLDDGLDGDVNCLQVYNGRLIAAGNFGNAGDISVHRIAAWSRTSN